MSSNEDSDVFTFTATSSNPDNAAFAANTYAEQYIVLQQNSLIAEYDARVEVLEDQLAGIDDGTVDPGRQDEYERELEDLAVSTELARTSSSSLIDAATPPGAPYEPNTTRTVTLALVVGLLIGLGAAFLVDYLDTTIRDEDDLQAATGLPTLGLIPLADLPQKATDGHIVTRDAPQSPAAEAYRSLRTAIRFISLDRPTAHRAGHQRPAGRGQDHDGHEPRRRCGPLGPAGDVDRLRSAQASGSPVLRPAERRRLHVGVAGRGHPAAAAQFARGEGNAGNRHVGAAASRSVRSAVGRHHAPCARPDPRARRSGGPRLAARAAGGRSGGAGGDGRRGDRRGIGELDRPAPAGPCGRSPAAKWTPHCSAPC